MVPREGAQGAALGRQETDGPRDLSGVGFLLVGIAAALLHAAFDAVTWALPQVTPPHLRLWDGPEEFQTLSPLAVSIAFSCVSGLIAVISVAALRPSQRKPARLAILVTGLWAFSEVLLRATWLTTPWPATVLALLAGLVRGAAVGWTAAAMARVLSRPVFRSS